MEKETIKFSQWSQLDLRVGKIIAIENIEGADKLYKLQIDLGKELGKRTFVAGIKPYYKKEQLKDKKVIVFTNLEPRKLKGIESQGMVLAAVSEDEQGKEQVRLLMPDEEIREGSRVR